MGVVIPDEVLAQLRELHAQSSETVGYWRSEDLARQMDIPIHRARNLIRESFRQGKLEVRRFRLGEEQALSMGLLGATSLRMYRWTDEDRGASDDG